MYMFAFWVIWGTTVEGEYPSSKGKWTEEYLATVEEALIGFRSFEILWFGGSGAGASNDCSLQLWVSSVSVYFVLRLFNAVGVAAGCRALRCVICC